MSEQPTDRQAKSPVDAALDAFLYAPIGLLFDGSTVLPQLVEKGRNQVTMAKMIGQFALKQAGDEASKAAGRLTDQAAGILEFIGGSVTPVSEPPPAPSPPPATRPVRPDGAPSPARDAARRIAAGPAADAEAASARSAPSDAPKRARAPRATKAARASAPPVATAAEEVGVVVTALAIPDYDGLSASQVVNRLAGLEAGELDAVRRYELANRGRKTILSKIAQLQSA